MHQICFHIGSRPIYWYGVMFAAGFLAVGMLWSWMGRREGRPAGFASDLGFWIMLGGILGARLAYVIANFQDYVEAPWTIIRIDQGGLIYYGGLLGGIITVIIFARVKHLDILRLGDFAIAGIPLGHAFGRIGCFLNGCCYGKPTQCALGVIYPPGSEPALYYPGLHVHPTQLYEVGANLLLCALLVWLYRRRRASGMVLVAYLLLYPAVRFADEFLRGDPRLRYAGLTDAQWLSLAFMAMGVGLFIGIRLRARRKIRERKHDGKQP